MIRQDQTQWIAVISKVDADKYKKYIYEYNAKNIDKKLTKKTFINQALKEYYKKIN